MAFENSDSWTLRFDYLPADLSTTTIQLRDFRRAASDEPEAEPEAVSGIPAQPF